MAGRIGQQFGNYRLLRLIGHGGFADVYLGEHIYMGTQAAIKVLHTQLGTHEVVRFRQEASMVARLEHPHIVRVLEFGVESTTPFLVLNYAPNGTLRERYPRGTILPLPTILNYVGQVAEALQYAHNEKIIHRDIKPENMLLGRRNEVLLGDFGIALISHNSQSQSVQDMAGTAAYMAPEQIEARPRPASDQYALGVIVYEWFSGSCPFQGTLTEIALKHVTADPPSLQEKVPGFSPAIEQVILTALAKNPAHRFPSVLAFAQALEQASHVTNANQDSAEMPTLFLADKTSPSASPPTPQIWSGLPPAEILRRAGDQSATEQAAVSAVPPTVITPPGQAASLPTPHSSPQAAPLSTPHSSPDAAMLLLNQADKMEWPGSTPRVEWGGGPVTPFFGFEVTPPSPPPSPPPPQRKFSSGILALLVTLAVIVVGGGVFGAVYFLRGPGPQVRNPNNAHPLSPQAIETAVVSMQASHQQAVDAYNQAVEANGIMFGFNAQHTRVNPYENFLSPAHTGNLQRVWTTTIGGPIYYSSPVVENGSVYVGAQDGQLYAINAITGQHRWVASLGSVIDSSPAVANGVVYAGTHEGKLYALNTRNGHVQWMATTRSTIHSSPTVVDGTVYIGSHDSKLYAFAADSGHLKWAVSTGGSISYSTPAVANGIVYIGSNDGKLYAFAADNGHLKWAVPTGSLIFSSPAVANGIVYVGSNDGKLYAFDATSGQKQWAIPTGGEVISSPAVANGVVYIGSNDHKLYAFDAVSGQREWVASTTDVIEASPIVANGLVYISSWDHGLYAFDALSGHRKWLVSTGGKLYSSPMVANGIVYVGGVDGKVYAFSLTN